MDLVESSRFYKHTNEEDYSTVIWGKWDPNFLISKKPMLAKFMRSDEMEAQGQGNSEEREQHNNPEMDEDKIKDIIFGNQFKLVLYNDGTLYSWGISTKGCLGLGKDMRQTKNSLEKIDIKDVIEVKVGENHVLALNSKGEVYAWGDNSK